MNPELITNLIEYVQISEDVRADLLQKVASLETELQSLQGELTKTAEASVDVERVERTVESLIKAGQLKGSLRKEAVDRFSTDPSFMLDCLDKMAKAEIDRKSTVPSLGRSIPVESMTQKTATKDSETVWAEGLRDLARYSK